MELLVENTAVTVRDGAQKRTMSSCGRLFPKSGTRLAVRGASGAGKTTFPKLLSVIAFPDTGRVAWGRMDISSPAERQRDARRGRNVDIVFQDSRLSHPLTELVNAVLPFSFRRRVGRYARGLLKSCGVPPDTRAGLLSRGEMPGTTLVRAILGTPPVILADEPTANVDKTNGTMVPGSLL